MFISFTLECIIYVLALVLILHVRTEYVQGIGMVDPVSTPEKYLNNRTVALVAVLLLEQPVSFGCK
jgi:hypothetical protein